MDIHVVFPQLVIEKEQRNISTGGTFTKEEIAVKECDCVQYRITVKNIGTAPAYHVTVQDVLNSFLYFSEINKVSSGNIRFIESKNTLEWTLDTIDNGATEVLTFTVMIACGKPAYAQTENSASVIYTANPAVPVSIGPVFSNQVIQKYPNLLLAMCCNANCIRPWNLVTVSLAIVVPTGTTAYDVKLSSMLSCGLEFAGNAAKDGHPVDVEVRDHIIYFPTENTIDATSERVVIHYQFDVKVKACTNRFLGPCCETVIAHVDWSTKRDDSQKFSENSCCELPYVTGRC